jgi:hypothetical protein
MNVFTKGIRGIRVYPWLNDCTYVVKSSEPFGKFPASAELSFTRITETFRAGTSKGKMGYFRRLRRHRPDSDTPVPIHCSQCSELQLRTHSGRMGFCRLHKDRSWLLFG